MTEDQKLEQRLFALASERRIAILRYLKKHHSATVSAIARELKIRVPSASQHLNLLYEAGIVTFIKRGMFVSYRLLLKQEEPVRTILRVL